MTAVISALSLVRLGILAGYCFLVSLGLGWWGIPLLLLFCLPCSKAPAVAVTVSASPAGRVGP